MIQQELAVEYTKMCNLCCCKFEIDHLKYDNLNKKFILQSTVGNDKNQHCITCVKSIAGPLMAIPNMDSIDGD